MARGVLWLVAAVSPAAHLQVVRPPDLRPLARTGQPTPGPRGWPGPRARIHASLADGSSTAVLTEAQTNGGWFDAVRGSFEGAITSIHDVVHGMGVDNAYGISIVVFTVAVKALLLPGNVYQMNNSGRMLALKPKLDRLKERYSADMFQYNQAVTDLYAKENVRPFVSALPVLLQIPIFFTLYRAITSLARQKVLDEPFLWIPNIDGPVQDLSDGLKWLVDGWEGSSPPLGWHDTLCYLLIPAMLFAVRRRGASVAPPPSSTHGSSARSSSWPRADPYRPTSTTRPRPSRTSARRTRPSGRPSRPACCLSCSSSSRCRCPRRSPSTG